MSVLNLPCDINQTRAIGQYAIDMLTGRYGGPSDKVLERVALFHRDAFACGVSALHSRERAPFTLWREARSYAGCHTSHCATLLATQQKVPAEKAVLAAAAAVREWDSNGTNFGYNPEQDAIAGEFGHNDFYAVALAAAEQRRWNGRQFAVAMVVLDEIRGRLAERFSLKTYSIDHVVHGGIASAAVYGAALGATAEQIESAIGLLVAHFVPFRAIRHGHQLSDSKGASAAMTAEMAVSCVHRALAGFVGPADIFRNPKAFFCLFEPPTANECSPFDLALATEGDEFAVMDMHFKLGLYEHQSAGAIQAIINLLSRHGQLLEQSLKNLSEVEIRIYEPAYGIICDPAKRSPNTRQSADHSLFYIVATLLRKAWETKEASWKQLMLLPDDYSQSALQHSITRELMQRIRVIHGGDEFDRRYPEGIPTAVALRHRATDSRPSEYVEFPLGHSRAQGPEFTDVLETKISRLLAPAIADPAKLNERLANLRNLESDDIAQLNYIELLGWDE